MNSGQIKGEKMGYFIKAVVAELSESSDKKCRFRIKGTEGFLAKKEMFLSDNGAESNLFLNGNGNENSLVRNALQLRADTKIEFSECSDFERRLLLTALVEHKRILLEINGCKGDIFNSAHDSEEERVLRLGPKAYSISILSGER